MVLFSFLWIPEFRILLGFCSVRRPHARTNTATQPATPTHTHRDDARWDVSLRWKLMIAAYILLLRAKVALRAQL